MLLIVNGLIYIYELNLIEDFYIKEIDFVCIVIFYM